MGLSNETSLALGNLGMSRNGATLTENLADVVTGSTAALNAMQASRRRTEAHEEHANAHAPKNEIAAVEGRTGMLIRQFETLAVESATLAGLIKPHSPFCSNRISEHFRRSV
jgi:hypothetical protein